MDIFNTIVYGMTTASTVVTAASTVALVWATWRLASLTETLAHETRLAREHAARADIQGALERDNEDPGLIEVIVKNVSNATAKDIKVEVYSGEYVVSGSPLGPFTYRIPSLLPGSHWRFYSNRDIETNGKDLNVDVSFHDGFEFRKKCVKYELKTWHDVNLKSNQPERRVVKALERIADAVGNKR